MEQKISTFRDIRYMIEFDYEIKKADFPHN